MIKPLARLGVVVVAVASAVWLYPATVAIVAWRSSGPSRLAYLSPLFKFWAALAATIAVVAFAAYIWRRLGRTLDEFAHILSPLSLLLLWLVPFAPWIADRAPTLLVFAGPLRWAIAAGAVVGVAGAARRTLKRPGGPERRAILANIRPLDRRIAFAIAFVVYAAMGLRYAAQSGFNGDEPHYLVITHSLLVDHDLDISNNHERRDYSAFFSSPLLPDYLRRGKHEEIYSIHAPGLPAMLLPAYTLAGASGAVVFVALLAAMASVVMLSLGERVAGTRAGWATWAVVSFSVPFVPHAWLIYPEGPAALIVACGVLRLWDPPVSAGSAARHGLLLALLPWLHTKFVVFLALFTAYQVLRLWPRVRHIVAMLVPIAIGSGLWLLSFYWMYGVFDPQAPYGDLSETLVLGRNIPRGVLGLLFDPKFGLLVYSPLYLLALPGAWFLLRDAKHQVATAATVVMTVVFVLSTTRFYMWWGGSSPPARFLVPIVPLLVPVIAIAFARLDGVLGRALIGLSVTATLCIALVALGSYGERLVYSNPHGLAVLPGALQGPAPLDRMLPTFTDEDWIRPFAHLVTWIAAFAVACGLAFAFVRAGVIRTSYGAAVIATVVFLTASGVGASRLTPAARAIVARDGQLALLKAYDPSRFHPVDVSRAVRVDDAAVRAMTIIDLSVDGQEPGVSTVVELPEGKYEARVWAAGATARAGDVQIVTPQGAILAAVAGPLANPTSIAIDIPVTAPVALRLTGPASATTLQRAELSALALVPRSSRIVDRVVAVEPIGNGPVRGLLAYADDRSYPEGGVYWTRGTDRSTTVVTSTDAAGVKLILHVGPRGGGVVVDAGSLRFDVDFKPNETRELTVELGGRLSRTLVSVRASRSFVPAAYDSNNSDRRSLGCQVRPVLF